MCQSRHHAGTAERPCEVPPGGRGRRCRRGHMRRGHGFARQRHFFPGPGTVNGVGPALGGPKVRRGRQDHDGARAARDRGSRILPGPPAPVRSRAGRRSAARSGQRRQRVSMRESPRRYRAPATAGLRARIAPGRGRELGRRRARPRGRSGPDKALRDNGLRGFSCAAAPLCAVLDCAR